MIWPDAFFVKSFWIICVKLLYPSFGLGRLGYKESASFWHSFPDLFLIHSKLELFFRNQSNKWNKNLWLTNLLNSLQLTFFCHCIIYLPSFYGRGNYDICTSKMWQTAHSSVAVKEISNCPAPTNLTELTFLHGLS